MVSQVDELAGRAFREQTARAHAKVIGILIAFAFREPSVDLFDV